MFTMKFENFSTGRTQYYLEITAIWIRRVKWPVKKFYPAVT